LGYDIVPAPRDRSTICSTAEPIAAGDAPAIDWQSGWMDYYHSAVEITLTIADLLPDVSAH
jgi:hypothetical protein